MRLNRAWIEARIPHQGRMCLLDEVIDWNAQHIRCRTATHRAPDNPLRSHGRLGIAGGIEYAAQAMALHGALAGGAANDTANTPTGAPTRSQPQVGLLAGLRDVRLVVARLDDIDSDLICEATHLAGDGLTALYQFALRDRDRILLSGRASVVLDAGGRLIL
ncbi:MAG: 3-hydroxylacyl-ACP dehydratase [Pseudomonadota bacterium]|nr:3-hydroxylacyl-ACP dehydratase [Pseudomonadota bacterium]